MNLAGTTAAGDLTSLTIFVPNSSTDVFGGLIAGTGQFVMGGFGTLKTGSINFQGTGGITAASGTLEVNGTIARARCWSIRPRRLAGWEPGRFRGRSCFNRARRSWSRSTGHAPGSEYTQLVDTDATNGVDLGFSTLAASINYPYEESDLFTVISAPVVQNSFANVIAGMAILDGVPFAVSTGQTSVKLAPLQSVTSTRLTGSGSPSYPGQPVSFTATVSTRTAAVPVGTVSFLQGGAVVATVPVSSGTAVYTTTSLPLGTTPIQAVYNGTSDNVGSTSATLGQTVVPFPTATRITSLVNPSALGQPVTIQAAVFDAAGPVTAGTVTFRRGKRLLGTVALDGSGTASLSISSLPAGVSRIQAIYNGSPGELSSVSPILAQTVDRVTTATVISFKSLVKPNGRVRYFLVATTSVGGTPIRSGKVVFRRNGHAIGTARLKNGAAVLRLRRNAAQGGIFVARFQGSRHLSASNSAPIVVDGISSRSTAFQNRL